MHKSKKAVSEIVTTILIILLSLAAIIIIWNVVVPMIQKSSGEAETEILTVDANIAKASVYIDETAGNLSLTITRGADSANISSMKVIITGETKSATYELTKTSVCHFPDVLETKTCVFNIKGLGDITKISIYPISLTGKAGVAEEYTATGSEATTPPNGWNGPVTNPTGGGQISCTEICTSVLKVFSIINQTVGYSSDRVKLENMKTGDMYSSILTSEGQGTITIGGKVYGLEYFGSSMIPSEERYIKLTSPEGREWKVFNYNYIVISPSGGVPPPTTYTFYRDADGDTYGNLIDTTTSTSTTPPPGYVSDNTDCNDNPSNGANYNPGIVESSTNRNTFDGIDQNCDGGDNLQTCGTINVADAVYFIDNDVSTTTTCLTVQANGITINMNGFNMTGDFTLGPIGIDNSGGYNGTTVMNGYIYDFKIGIYNVEGDDGNFTNLTITASGGVGANVYGIYLNGDNNYITNNNASNIVYYGGYTYGIFLWSSSNNTLTDNTANSNSNYGIYLTSSSDNILTDNNVCNNNYQDLYCYSSTGNSGSGNKFGTGKVIVCSNPTWPSYPADYSYCP